MTVEPASSRLKLFSLFLAEQRDPAPFHERLAEEAVAELPADLSGQQVIDLGCGPGHYTRALRARGAAVIPVDLARAEFALPGGPPGGELLASGMALPVRTGSIDGLLCSNMIEHTPDPLAVFDEIERVVRPGGWIWLSWTNWYSPWGGHDVSPFHYLGPGVGLRTYRRVTGREPKNVPMESLFPLHIGATLRELRSRNELEIIDVAPRYYPSQRWILSVPGLREVATWNCRVIARRVDSIDATPTPARSGRFGADGRPRRWFDVRRLRWKWTPVVLAVVVAAAAIVGALVAANGSSAPPRPLTFAFDRPGPLPAQPWATTTGTWHVANAAASVSAAVPGWTIAALDRGVADGEVGTTIDVAGAYGGLAFRVRDDANFWALTASPRFGTWNLSEVLDGNVRFISNTGLTPARGRHTLEVRLDGSFIDVVIDGHGVSSIDDPSLQGATGAGLVLLHTTNTAAARWESFNATFRNGGAGLVGAAIS